MGKVENVGNVMDQQTLLEEIHKLKEKYNVTFLAHYYQPIEIQKIADYLGDSLGLAKQARDRTDMDYILFAGVNFMAETASILNQQKTILSPDLEAGCPLSAFISATLIKEYKIRYPNAPLIVYVNTTAETKANADVCCTSSNAIRIAEKTAQEWNTKTILFGPDKNLAQFVRANTDLNIITVPERGNCPIHNLFSIKDVKKQKQEHPEAKLIVHPESPWEVQELADFVGSTSQMMAYTQENPSQGGFIIGTETGLTEHLRWKFPEQSYFPLSKRSVCKNMKKMSLPKIYAALKSIGTPEQDNFEVRVSPDQTAQALIAVNRMMDFS
ncbi:MAG: quinolinate synthase NadA [Promethearchaeota archaeon]